MTFFLYKTNNTCKIRNSVLGDLSDNAITIVVEVNVVARVYSYAIQIRN